MSELDSCRRLTNLLSYKSNRLPLQIPSSGSSMSRMCQVAQQQQPALEDQLRLQVSEEIRGSSQVFHNI